MINSTRCAFMAKQACATFSKVVRKITPPRANNLLKFFFALFAILTLNAATAWAEVTYKLTKVTSVVAGEKYVFEQSGYVMNNTVSSSALQCTNNYNTTELAGTESYVWTLESVSGGFYMKNVSKSSSQYLNNSSSTGVSFGNKSSIWKFTFTDGIALIQNTSNSDRFLGWTTSTSHAYKAYATSNLSSYPHAITIYKLEAETSGGENPGEGGGEDPTPDPEEPGTGEDTWTLVTNASDLKAGDVVVIVSNTKGVVASNITDGYMGQASATFSADKSTITTLPSEAVQLTMGGTAGAWTLTYNGKQLGATALKKVAWDSGTKTWSITITDGNATIQNATSSYGRFLHNVQSTRFTTYTSDANTSMLLPQIYKKNTAPTDCDNAVTITQGTPENGSFKLDKTEKQSTCNGAVIVTLSNIQPAAGYKFSAITQTGVDASKVTIDNNTKTVTYDKNTTGTSTINVTFEQLPKLATPTNLKVSSVSCANALLAWDAVDGANKYKLILTNTSTATQTTSNPNTNSVFITLSAGVTYSWTIQAIGDGATNTDSEVATGADFTTHYTITYNTNGGSDVEDGCGTTLPETLPTTSKSHYTFDGWYMDEDFTTLAEASATLTKNTDLYAKWTANTYTITFNAGTGTCGTESATATNAVGVSLPTATPSDACDEVGWKFAGWATSSVVETTTAPTLLKANDKYQPTSDITLYAVYSQTETTRGEGEELSQTLEYDSWSYTGSTTNKGEYRMFHKDSYVESAPFDLSTLTKVVVYGGTFGGDKYNSLTIGDGTNIWKSVTVTGNSQTGKNSFTGGSALSGNGKLRITSNSGTASTDGVRISKIDIYTVSSITTTTYNSNPDCTPPAEYTITWWANGEKYYTQTAVEGKAIVVPMTSPDAATYACDDKVFIGWVDTEITGSIDTKPTLITEFNKITENKDYFAVFATKSSSVPTAYTAGDVGNFVLAAKNGDKWYALPTNPTVNSGKIQGKEIPVTTTDGVEHVTTTNALGYTWTIANAANGQTISDGSKYIYHKNGGVDNTDLSYGTGTSYTWKIEKEDAGLTFKAMNGTTVNDRGMLVNGTKFGGYALSNETTNGYYRISVLPIADEISYSGYVTTCPYTITFNNWDNTELASYEVAYGQTPEYKGATPTKAADAQHTYTFSGWDPEIEAVTGDQTYTAQYTATINKYTITFNNWDGTTLATYEVEYGQTPVYAGEAPTKAATGEHTYTFTGWTPAIVAVTGEATYTATYSQTLNQYTISVTATNGTITGAGTYNYGAEVTLTATADFDYEFVNWTVGGEVVSTANPYTFPASANVEVVAKFQEVAATTAKSGKFSTGKYEYAEFATGNLQYKPSTDTWRFAKQQYQVVGEDNINVGDPNYKGWIDMFGWSCDGKFGVNPSNKNTDYNGDFTDWGTLFPVEDNYSTLTADQWDYLLNTRANASVLKQNAKINGVVGILLFPDNWTGMPEGCTVSVTETEFADDEGTIIIKNHEYTLEQWAKIEANGAVFLPGAGRRTGGFGNKINYSQVEETNSANLNDGYYRWQDYTNYVPYYWTSTKIADNNIKYLTTYHVVSKDPIEYGVGYAHVGWGEYARYGQSVRLAKVTSTLIEIGDGDNSDVIEANKDKMVNVQVNRAFKADNGYYTICLPFALDADEIGKAYELGTITEYEANGGININLTEVDKIEAGKPYLVLPKTLTKPIFENVTIVNTTGETIEPASGAGVNVTFTGIINGVGEETNGTTHYYVGDNGYLYNGKVAKLGLRAFFTITNGEGQAISNVRARVVANENVETGVEDIITTDAPVKVIENGQLIIIRDGVKYNVQGQRL